MKNVFTDFWKVNLGHVAIAAIFLFGLGVSWSQQNARVDMLDQRESNRDTALNLAVTTAAKERLAQIAVIDARMDAVERWQKDATTILKAIEVLTIEQRHTNESLKDIRIDLKDVQKRLKE